MLLVDRALLMSKGGSASHSYRWLVLISFPFRLEAMFNETCIQNRMLKTRIGDSNLQREEDKLIRGLRRPEYRDEYCIWLGRLEAKVKRKERIKAYLEVKSQCGVCAKEIQWHSGPCPLDLHKSKLNSHI